MTYQEALKKAANYCAKYETCPFDLKRKFHQWNIPREFYEEIITTLKKNKFIDEQRYSENFIRDKLLLNHWGRHKIRYALLQKQIPEKIIQKALNEIIDPQEYQDILRKILSQKLKSYKETDRNKLKQKLINFALQRGFEHDTAYQITEELLKERL